MLVAALVTAALAAAAPAYTDDANAVHYYLSLGDSLAASFQPNGDSGHGYAEQVYVQRKAQDPTLRLVKLGCGGETTHSMIFANPCGYSHGSQLAEAASFLHAHARFVTLVTIDIGGNDVLLCVFLRDRACLDAASASAATNLATILGTLHDAAGADVPIIGMNYYDPFLAFWFGSPTAAQITEQMVVQFNDVLDSAYGKGLADVETAFQTTNPTPVGGIPLNVLRICQWTWMCTSAADIHPNTAGYGVIAQAFVDPLP
jgi:lysophospholipase L1-like esterase